MKSAVLVLFLAGCSMFTVRGQSKPGAADCTRSNGMAGTDLSVAAGAVVLARDERAEGNHKMAYAAYATATYLAISAAYGFARTHQCRSYMRSVGKSDAGGFDWVYIPAVVLADQARRDLERIRKAIEKVTGQ